jgi:YidC/Oxa1 family membrane protein insertase
VSKNSIAFILCAVALFGAYSYLSQRQLQQAAPPGAPTTEQAADQPEGALHQTEQTSGSNAASGLGAVAQTFSTEGGPESLAIVTPSVKIDLSNRGGCIEGVVLNGYQRTQGASDPVALIEKLEPCKALGVRISDLDLREEPALLSSSSPQGVTIEQRKDGLHVRRTLHINETGYQGKLTIEVHNTRTDRHSGLVEFELGATSTKEGAASMLSFDQSSMRHLSYYADDELNEEILHFEETPAAEVLVLEPSVSLDWAASGGTYFMFAASPLFKSPVGIRFERQPFNMQPDRQSPAERTIYEGWLQHQFDLAPGTGTSWAYDLYLGPKDLADLTAAGHNLEKSINYGFFQIVAWPMFKALQWIEGLVGNWGVAILILTLLIRIVFYPLTAKSYTASKKMQKLQPALNELKEKYKDDKQKQQQELMAMMAKEGVNPLGGCLPVLPQIPVFFGLNAVLMHTFDLRQAPLGLWIQDLSTHDPYYISPLLMALLMYVQQRMTPMPSMDPTQAKIMRFLPIIFALFMISYPSGLVVYIITSTIFSIAQQQFMMKTYKDT